MSIGIVISENTVESETTSTEKSVSPPYFDANIVVIAADGALHEITEDTSITPLTPQRYKSPSATDGSIISREATVSIQAGLKSAFITLLLVR